jgi:choice-of-anchor C domain-containing protein
MITAMKHVLLTLAVFPLIVCAIAPRAAANSIVVNGDFEDPIITNLAQGWDIYYGGQSFPGWAVGGHSIDIVCGPPFNYGAECWTAASGYQSVDLNGYGPGSISQHLNTVAGQAYELSFMMAGNVIGGPFYVTMEFLWHGTVVGSVGFDVADHDGYDVGWTRHVYTLTALTDVTRLTFASLVAGGSRGPALDDVQVHAIPESVPDSGPGAWGVICVGLTLLAGRRFGAWRRACCPTGMGPRSAEPPRS